MVDAPAAAPLTVTATDVFIHGKRLVLTPNERAVFRELYLTHGACVPFSRLAAAVWDPRVPVDRAGGLDGLITRLRRKLRQRDPVAAAWIVNVRAEGYRLDLPGWTAPYPPRARRHRTLTLSFAPDFGAPDETWELPYDLVPDLGHLVAGIEHYLDEQVPRGSFGLVWTLATPDGQVLTAPARRWVADGTAARLVDVGLRPGMVLRLVRLAAGGPAVSAVRAGAARRRTGVSADLARRRERKRKTAAQLGASRGSFGSGAASSVSRSRHWPDVQGSAPRR